MGYFHFLSSNLGRLRCLEGDVRRDPDSSGLLPLGPDLLLAAALLLLLQINCESSLRLVETCSRQSYFWSVSQYNKSQRNSHIDANTNTHPGTFWVPLTPQREVKSQAVLHVPRQSWTDQAGNITGAWAQPGVSQQERSWKEKTAFIFHAKLSLPLNLLAMNVPIATRTWH